MKLKSKIDQEERVISDTYEYIAVGTTSINIPTDCDCDIVIVGGGGGGGLSSDNTYAYASGGGSGACFEGTLRLTSGTYTISVGGGGNGASSVRGTARGGAGGNTILSDYLGNTIISAGGGGGGTAWCYGYSAGAGGIIDTSGAQIISETINSNGNNGKNANGSSVYPPSAAGGASLYNGYGKGGTNNSKGVAGYFKITINATMTVDVLKTYATKKNNKYYVIN